MALRLALDQTVSFFQHHVFHSVFYMMDIAKMPAFWHTSNIVGKQAQQNNLFAQVNSIKDVLIFNWYFKCFLLDVDNGA